ncbi:hypothetical protein H920_11397 [Fukomys damarensis]|uniref:Uncharacterized protein n=1 Tax=Fukomys damarensis TaxID=885580 RepID=A0A091D557_FUKDA|nr:hypothetical protein H920_11397 [Fukomys damarensis]
MKPSNNGENGDHKRQGMLLTSESRYAVVPDPGDSEGHLLLSGTISPLAASAKSTRASRTLTYLYTQTKRDLVANEKICKNETN